MHLSSLLSLCHCLCVCVRACVLLLFLSLCALRDKDAKQRLKLFNRSPNAITASCFNPSGSIYAYALGYDWSKGVEYYQRQKDPCCIMLHPVNDAEIAKKKK